MPNTVQSPSYDVEYGKRQGVCISKDAVKRNDRVVIIDDLVATGGTLSAAIQLVHLLGGTVVECACVVELQMFVNPTPESGLPSRTQLFCDLGIDHVPIWGLLSEDILTLKADLPSDYTDDGEEH
jgi:adenine phosphoribosyltransferase